MHWSPAWKMCRMKLPIWSEALVKRMTPEQRAQAVALIKTRALPIWMPLPGPQTIAYRTRADIVGYGGAAGGGKTDLACGKALTQHESIMILRREATQLVGIIDRLQRLLGGRDGYNGSEKIWRLPGRQIEFGSVPNLGDEAKYQGRPHDLLVFDEAANFLEKQIRFLLGWLRTTTPGQHCQALLTFNPPTNAEGQWIISFFAPWLDAKYPDPALPGELRWAASLPIDEKNPNGRDLWVADGCPFILVDGEPCYDFDPSQHDPLDIICPLSRTFIPSRVTDNPYLAGTGYMAQLQALPEPLRSQMLKGDFAAGMVDDPWQVIPTSWVDAAMERWVEPIRKAEMMGMGVDVARGGKDATVIYRRHEGEWYDRALVYPGKETPNGPAVAGLVVAATRDSAPQHIDVLGVGSSPYDFLVSARQQAYGINVNEKSQASDRSGVLNFKNLRSQLWWQLREDLDPANNIGIQLPPDKRLRADLIAPKWELQGKVIYVESRDDIEARIGRSPDWGSALILARIPTPKIKNFSSGARRGEGKSYDPYSSLG